MRRQGLWSCFRLLLPLSEVVSYLAPTEAHHVRVDPTASQKLRVEFDGTLHALTCGQVNLDAMDVAGEQQEPRDHTMGRMHPQRASAVRSAWRLGRRSHLSGGSPDYPVPACLRPAAPQGAAQPGFAEASTQSRGRGRPHSAKAREPPQRHSAAITKRGSQSAAFARDTACLTRRGGTPNRACTPARSWRSPVRPGRG